MAAQQIVSQIEAAGHVQANAREADSRYRVVIHQMIVIPATDAHLPRRASRPAHRRRLGLVSAINL